METKSKDKIIIVGLLLPSRRLGRKLGLTSWRNATLPEHFRGLSDETLILLTDTSSHLPNWLEIATIIRHHKNIMQIIEI